MIFDRTFYVTITGADIGSKHGKSLSTHPGEVWTKSNGKKYTKFWAFRQKMVNHFGESVDAILEEVSVI